MDRSRRFYDRLFGCPPALVPSPDFHEYEPHPGLWLQITSGIPPQAQGRLRFGVPDLRATTTVLEDAGIKVSGEGTVPGVVKWANFEDPDGNPLGLYQDLQKYPLV